MQASIPNALGHSTMSDIPTRDVISFQTFGRSILSHGEDASSGTRCNCVIIRSRGDDNFLLRTSQVRQSVHLTFIKLSSSNLLSENINDVSEMQSFKQFRILQLDLKRRRA